MAKKSGFTQMIDDTLIHTIDDDLVINVGTIKALIPLMSQGIIERDQLQIIITVLDVRFEFKIKCVIILSIEGCHGAESFGPP
jgi:hypothetical protein